MKRLFLLSVLFITLILSSCRPYHEDKYVEVTPNQTAYVIPLETGTKDNQAKLKSEEYLEQNKVVSKRIYTPTQWHKTGRIWGGEWIPAVRVIIVDRTPVTREWNGGGSGTNSTSNEAIAVESKESIGFEVCITTTSSIPEELATKFLYSYSGKTLAQVMDQDVRGYIQNILTTEFGSRTLTDCQNQRSVVFETMRKAVTEHFKLYGIQIVNVGSAGQFVYSNSDIQTAINSKYSSEMKISAAKNEVDAAQKFAAAKSAIESQKHLDADINIKNAIADGIRSGKLPVPSTVAGDFDIMKLYGLKGLNTSSK